MTQSPMGDNDISRLRDIGLMENALGKRLARLRRERDTIFKNRVDPHTRQLTDHAIVRYMERVEELDLEAVKARFRGFVAECAPSAVKGILSHPSGPHVVLTPHGTVVTILPTGATLGYESSEIDKDT